MLNPFVEEQYRSRQCCILFHECFIQEDSTMILHFDMIEKIMTAPVLVFMILLSLGMIASACGPTNSLGDFDGQSDVGAVGLSGSVSYNTRSDTYRITGSGENIWDEADAFHFAWHQVEGDLALTTDVQWIGSGSHEHRKAGWMVRGGLEENAPYADVVVHGDGLIALQYRQVAGGPTLEVQSGVSAPAAIRLERDGHLFTASVARDGEPFQPIGSVTVELNDPVYAGLVVCSHDNTAEETAVFSNVGIDTLGVFAEEDRVVESTLEIVDIETGERRIVRRAREHFEAPNWSIDGASLIYNSRGSLYTIPVAGGEPELIDTGFADRCNNDHGLSPDGTLLAISHSPERQSLIYVLPSNGGEPRLVTELGPSYWHGWSPDGQTLTYCASRNGEYDVYTIPVEGGLETRLTDAPGLDDGPDYSPDGRYIYFNSVRTGQMKIWRMEADGSNEMQITPDDEYGDWFAHPSPDGRWLVFVSYDKSVEGHPANKNVVLRLMPVEGGEPQVLATLFGGQGTINVPSWSPDSREVAFVSYRLVGSVDM